MGNQSLKNILFRFSLYELIYSVWMVLLFLSVITISINSRFTYPANQPERELVEMQQKMSEGTLNESDIPDFYDYELEENGRIVKQTIPDKYASYLLEAKETGRSQSNRWIGTNFFVKLEGHQQSLILSYQLLSDFTSPQLRHFLPSAELIYFLVSLLLWFVGFLLITYRVLHRLKAELIKIERTYNEVQNLNLAYKPQTSSIKEINQILVSMNGMSEELRTSLQEQWKAQRQQQEMFQGITHDLRTPLAVIKGNHELLEETALNEEQEELLKNAGRGISRLEGLIEQLKQISGITNKREVRETISEEVVAEWVELAKNLCSPHAVTLKLCSTDSSERKVYKEQINRALQNILLNSMENMTETKELTLSFEDQLTCYKITLKDTGSGFTPETLQEAKNKFFSTKKGNTGLGLSIVSAIMDKNNGIIQIENDIQDNIVKGARVCLLLQK